MNRFFQFIGILLLLVTVYAVGAYGEPYTNPIPTPQPEPRPPIEIETPQIDPDALFPATIEFGRPSLLIHNNDPLQAYIRFPQGGNQSDLAIEQWARNLLDDAMSEMELVSNNGTLEIGELNVQFDSYFVDNRYAGIFQNGWFTRTLLGEAEEIIQTFNIDLLNDRFLDSFEILDFEDMDNLLNLLNLRLLVEHPRTDGNVHNMDESWLSNLLIGHDGIIVILPDSSGFLPEGFGTLTVTLPYEDLGAGLLLGGDVIDIDLLPDFPGDYELPDDYHDPAENIVPDNDNDAEQPDDETLQLDEPNEPDEPTEDVDAAIEQNELASPDEDENDEQYDDNDDSETQTPETTEPSEEEVDEPEVDLADDSELGMDGSDGNYENENGQFEVDFDENDLSLPDEPTVPPQSSEVDPSLPMIAITFEDGPGIYLSYFLDLLELYGARATFTTVGNITHTAPQELVRAIELGNEVIGHSWNHRNLAKLTDNDVREQLVRTAEIIENITGTRSILFRPPFGEVSDTMRRISEEIGLAMVNWDIDSNDWESLDVNAIYNRVMEYAQNGSIIVSNENFVTTFQAYRLIIPELISRGFQLVTVSELLENTIGEIQPGRVYFSASDVS